MSSPLLSVLNRRFDRNVSALILLALTIFSAFIFYVANKALALAETYEDYFAETVLIERRYNHAKFVTSKGEFTVEFFEGVGTSTIKNFVSLVESGFYDGTKFHRVIEGFMVQGGDPLSKGYDELLYGTGGPGYKFKDEISKIPLVRGVLAMANSGPNTNGSQFFVITASATPHLQGKHTAFGRVVYGMDVVDTISKVKTKPGDIPISPVVVDRILLY